MPLMELLEKMHEKGRETARVMYGMRGMVCHHNTDFYGDCAPQDWYMAATPWVTGSAWLGLHVWEHYLYTKDLSILKRMYPVLRDMALFYQDFLIEVDGKLVTCPSVSPENRYILPDGYDTPICVGPAMDNQILREFFTALIKIQQLLGVDLDFSQTLADMASRLPQDKIGSKGQLLEWDQEYPELTPGMSHISHLFACHPGCSINWRDTPELMEAVKKSLEISAAHGGAVAGWPLAWHINMNARLLDGVRQTSASTACWRDLRLEICSMPEECSRSMEPWCNCRNRRVPAAKPLLCTSCRHYRILARRQCQGTQGPGARTVDLRWSPEC